MAKKIFFGAKKSLQGRAIPNFALKTWSQI